MQEIDETEFSDTLVQEGEPKSSTRILSAIRKAEDAFRTYQDTCRRIDEVYSLRDTYSDDYNWQDPDYDLFWASTEILKPAIYSRPPKPAVATMFSDRSKLKTQTAELLERVTSSAFDRAGIDEVMICVRDDLALANRGQMWVTYESDEKGGGQRVCIEHLDRLDFLHEPARKWAEVGWVARRAWMTRKEMRKRFFKHSGDAYQEAALGVRREEKRNGSDDGSRKAGVWEVWHKNDNRVYWVAEGCPVMLDEDKPHLDLSGFFPCPRPAYGTLRRRSLVPVPDYERYAVHFSKINKLTARIYLLLDQIRLKVLIPAGGDIANAIEVAMTSDDDSIVIPVPAAALMTGAGAGNYVQHIPIKEAAEAAQILIATRTQIFEDFYQLSGISDIMRGATEAEETLGAQQLKSQYGSVRVRDKVEELQRIARDVSKIVAEVASDKFSQKTLLDMSQMTIPTKREIEKKIKEIEDDAEKELEALAKQAKEMADQARQSGQPLDPQKAQEAQQQFQQAQQQIIQKYAPMLQQASDTVPIEDVIDLLRNDRSRSFAFEIATDSTILTDEMQEKASRNEFLGAFTAASQALMGIAAMGEAGAALAGGMLKFSVAPYRVGRELNGLIDDFIDAAPQMAAQMQQQGGSEGEEALAQANMQLAQAELQKAQAQTEKVQADAALKGQELQLKAAEAQERARSDQQKLMLELEKTRGTIAETEARIEKIYAEIQKMGIDAENQTRQQTREDVKASADIQMRQTDQAMNAQDRQRQAIESERNAQMSERQQSFQEQQGERSEQRADRQQDFSERQGERQQTLAERQAEREGAE